MTDIPKRVYQVWQTPLTIQDCGGLLAKLKLECSTCGRKFGAESSFANHMEKCLADATHNLNYLVHMHANRLLILQNRVAKFCGASQQVQYLECGLCNEEFDEEIKVKEHIRHCTNYKMEFGKFMDKSRHLFTTMLHSYEQLCTLFQKYVMDEHIIRIRETGTPPVAEGELPQLEPVGPDLYFDDLSEHFIEKYQEYIFVVTSFSDDVFIRYLKKKKIDERNAQIERLREELMKHEGTSGEYYEDDEDIEDIEEYLSDSENEENEEESEEEEEEEFIESEDENYDDEDFEEAVESEFEIEEGDVFYEEIFDEDMELDELIDVVM